MLSTKIKRKLILKQINQKQRRLTSESFSEEEINNESETRTRGTANIVENLSFHDGGFNTLESNELSEFNDEKFETNETNERRS